MLEARGNMTVRRRTRGRRGGGVERCAAASVALGLLVTSCSGSTEGSSTGSLGAVPLAGAGGGSPPPTGGGSSAGQLGSSGAASSGGAAGTSGGGSASAGQGNATAGAGNSPPEVDLVGHACWPPGSLGCNGTNQRRQLVCVGDPLAKWEAAGACAENERCDSTVNVGECAPLLSECVGHTPFVGMCVGDEYVECGVDLVTRAYQLGCTDRCLSNASGADCIQLGCGDGQASSTEACDDGNNENGDGCSAGCVWEPPQGSADPTAKYFGSPATISGDTIVTIGVDAHAPIQPRLHVFRSRGQVWSLEAKLDAAPGGHYGGALALDGDTLAVSGDDAQGPEGAGAVFIYQRTGSTWSLQQELVATRPDGVVERAGSQSFGSSLSLTGDTLAVGATGDDNQGGFSGAVYVFARTGGVFAAQAKLVAKLPDGTLDGTDSGSFGYSVSLSGNSLAVGALLAHGDEAFVGAAYIFERSGATWDEQARVRPPLPPPPSDTTGGQFGWAVRLKDDTLVVGSRSDRNYGGSADVFRRSAAGWLAEAHLVPPPDVLDEDSSIAEFGSALAISASGDVIAVGSPRDRVPGYYEGAIHVFSRQGDQWAWQARLQVAPSRAAGWQSTDNEFGHVVDMDGERILTGANTAETSGRAYLFEPQGTRWQERLELQALAP
jgi:cysteine-rich repeat protein